MGCPPSRGNFRPLGRASPSVSPVRAQTDQYSSEPEPGKAAVLGDRPDRDGLLGGKLGPEGGCFGEVAVGHVVEERQVVVERARAFVESIVDAIANAAAFPAVQAAA